MGMGFAANAGSRRLWPSPMSIKGDREVDMVEYAAMC